MIKQCFALLAVPALLSLAACEDPAKGVPPPADPAEAPLKTGATSAVKAVAGEMLSLDPAASSVGFVGSKVTGKHEGKFEKISGSVTLAGDKIDGGKITIDVDMTSVKTDQEKLDGHLKSADFFDVEKFPKATFASTDIKAGGEAGATHTVTGELTLHGEKKTVSFPAMITVAADGVNGTAEFSINRNDFKIVYAGKADDLIRDDVVVKLTLKAPRKH